MKKLIIFCFTLIFSLLLTNYAYASDDVTSTDYAYYWQEVEATSINQYNSNYESELYYSITKGIYAIACGEYDADYIKLVHTADDYTLDELQETYNYVNEVNDNVYAYVSTPGSEMMSVFTQYDYYETGYYIQVYKLVIVEYDVEDSISSSSSIYSDLKYLDINYEDYFTYEHTTIVSIAMMIDAAGGEHLVAYIYDPFNNDYDNQPALNLFDILTGVESNEYMQFISNSYNFYKLDLDMMDYFEDSLILEVEVNEILNVASDALNSDNDNYYPQHIILEKSNSSDVFQLSYYSIDTLKIDVEAELKYKYFTDTQYVMGIANELPYGFVYYINFDAYKNDEKFNLDKIITNVSLCYYWDIYQTENQTILNFDDIDFENSTLVERASKVYENITPTTVEIEYYSYPNSFKEYFQDLYNQEASTFTFNTLVRYDDENIDKYTELDFSDKDYCMYIGNIGTVDEPNYLHSFYDVDISFPLTASLKYAQPADIEFVTLTYLEDGVSYTVLVDSTNIEEETFTPGDGTGETVDPDEPFDWLAFIESVIEWLANNWQWVVAAIVLLIALSLIKYVKGAIDSLVWIFKTILNIILLPFKIIAYILDLIFKRK